MYKIYNARTGRFIAKSAFPFEEEWLKKMAKLEKAPIELISPNPVN